MLNKIEIPNQRQRAGKITTAVNFAACSAKSGRRVLVVDVDTETNCSSHFGIHPEEAHLNAYHTLIEPESDIREYFGSNCFSHFHKKVRCIEASINRVPIIELDPSCCASLDYFRFSHEVIHEL